ncbi:hypothetical protein [Spirosoma migulaei]
MLNVVKAALSERSACQLKPGNGSPNLLTQGVQIAARKPEFESLYGPSSNGLIYDVRRLGA